MTAVDNRRPGKGTRFSLLLLEDGEVLLSDVAVHYHFIHDQPVGSALHPLSSFPGRFQGRSANTSVSGRLKIGTRNLFFDCDDWRDPVIRIPFVSVQQVRPTRGNSRSRWSEESGNRSFPSDESCEDSSCVLVLSDSVIFQRENGIDHQYIDVQVIGKHCFTPMYISVVQLLEEINSLFRITLSTNLRKRNELLKKLVMDREAHMPFDITLLEYGVMENSLLDAAVSAVYAMSRAPGRFRITERNVYFMPIHGESSSAVQRIPVRNIIAFRRLKHGYRDAALEIGFKRDEDVQVSQTYPTFMVSFHSNPHREHAIEVLSGIMNHKIEMFNREELEANLRMWRSGLMSNFDYLMYLNKAAGRSFNDLSQYPIFPWILSDYESDTLDLTKADNFRDLMKPIGALDEDRFLVLKERFDEMPPPKFLYGTHYSTPAYTIYYLLRAAPAAMLRLQNGRFDTPDRLFHCVSSSWKSVSSGHGDVKELIPEFFTLDFTRQTCSGVVPSKSNPGDFLVNIMGLDLGTRHDGKRVDDVELPPWANGSAELFVRRNREALESEYVSARIHNWFDLIFGIKSRSAEAQNLFYTDVLFPNSFDSSNAPELNEEEMDQIETVYLEFGRTPKRIFGYPHPPRFGDSHTSGLQGQEQKKFQDELDLPGKAHKAVVDLRQCEREDQYLDLDPADSGLESQAENATVEELPISQNLGSAAQSTYLAGARMNDYYKEKSVVKGTFDNVMVCLLPRRVASARGLNDAHAIAQLSIQENKPTFVDDKSIEIVDMCVTQGKNYSSTDSRNMNSTRGLEEAGVCTVWADGHLKVHKDGKMLRSKYIEGVCCVVSIRHDMVAFGTVGGDIGMYDIDKGHTHIQSAAHDAEVIALEYCFDCDLVVSGSKDASIKVWRFDGLDNKTTLLRLSQELDAEGCVEDITVTVETNSCVTKRHSDVLLVATTTTDGNIIAWNIDVSSCEYDFPTPVWRSRNVGVSMSVRANVGLKRLCNLTWVFQGNNQRHTLASVHPEEKSLRIWSLEQEEMELAEVLLSEGDAQCISCCDESRTIFVGGVGGRISEFDSTGLCVGVIQTGCGLVRNVKIGEDGRSIYVLAGKGES